MNLVGAALVGAALGTPGVAEAAVSIEIASEAGPNANAQREWLQRLGELGFTGVRIRGARRGDEPRLDDFGTPVRPSWKLTGLLTRRGVLHLPGGRFTLRDRRGLADYLARLEGEGAEGVTAPRGAYGLTEEQFERVFAALTPPVGAAEAGTRLEPFVRRVVDAAGLELKVSRRAAPALRAASIEPPAAGLARGAALALTLRAEGLAFRPEKPPGSALRLVVEPATADRDAKGSAAGEPGAWPVGYEPEGRTSVVAPVLMQRLPVEIDGFMLAEALDAIAPRLGDLPVVYDRFVLRRDAIDPTTVPVKLARTETHYKRVLERLAFQARLRAQLRIDEAGRPFVWLTR